MAPDKHFSEFQGRASAWVIEAFGLQVASDKQERAFRFAEEALELMQASGINIEELNSLRDYVFSRKPGEVNQEIGGTMVTLASLAATYGLNIHDEGERELVKCWQKINEKQEKHANKIPGNPLPGTIDLYFELKKGGPSKAINFLTEPEIAKEGKQYDFEYSIKGVKYGRNYRVPETGPEFMVSHNSPINFDEIKKWANQDHTQVRQPYTPSERKPVAGEMTPYQRINDLHLVVITGVHDMQFPKNQDEKALCDILLHFNRKTIHIDTLEQFKRSLAASCNAIPNTEVKWLPVYNTDSNNDHTLYLGEGRKFTFKLLQIGS